MKDWVKNTLRGFGAMALLAFVFAWFGVYDTAGLPMLPRFGFWFMTIAVGFGAGYFVEPLISDRLGAQSSLPVRLFLIAALISIPVTLLLLAISPDPFSMLKLGVQYGYVLVVSLVVTVLNVAYAALSETTYSAGAVDGVDTDPAAAFMNRLPVKYRTAELYAISAEDHYLRVHTSIGEELILMRLADALRELEGASGLQTHRSWWVARDGVADSEKRDGRLTLILKSGGRALVSRTYSGAVKAARLV